MAQNNKTMTNVKSYRMNDEEYAEVEADAEAAGCSVSEYVRRKLLDKKEERMQRAIFLCLEYSRSNAAKLDLLLNMAGTTPEGRQDVISEYKVDLVELENEMMGGN